MKIDLLCNDGSPIGVTPALIWGRGVGGAELAMMTLMDVLAARGHEVTVYNDPTVPGDHNGVTYANLSQFELRAPRDALVIFRSPNPRYNPRYRSDFKAIWWSTDQRTVGDFRALAASVDFVVTISQYHTDYHVANYRIPADHIGHIDLGVRIDDYDGEVERIENRLIYCSIPDRGLDQLLAAWPLIRGKVEDATLVITSDYRLWGAAGPANAKHRLAWARQEGVIFLGAVPRRELIRHQLQAEIHAYPCTYEELFCISAAECTVAGALPVTSSMGALPTTNQFGIVVPGDPFSPSFNTLFADRVASLMTNERGQLEQMRRMAMAGGANRFNWNTIAEQWEHVFKEGKLP